MRELPILQQQAKNERGQRTFWLMDVFLKASGEYAAETLYFSSQAVAYGGNFYEPRLRSKPTPKQTLGAGLDGGQARIDNTDYEQGLKFLPKERFIEGSRVVIRFAWKLADGTVTVDEVFNGEIAAGTNLSIADNAINLNLTGDLYKPSVVLGAFPLAQRCVYKFNVNGLLPPDESLCGWQPIQGGNPVFCDKTEDGANGCIAHGNLHRIGAIPFFANVTVQIVSGDRQTSSGFPAIGRHKTPVDVEPTYPTNI